MLLAIDVGNTHTVRGRRYFTFVNRRLIRDRALMAVFYRSVRDEWRGEEFPALFLFIDGDADGAQNHLRVKAGEDNGSCILGLGPFHRLAQANGREGKHGAFLTDGTAI